MVGSWLTTGTPTGILALISDADLRDDVDRVAAAAGVQVIHATEPSGRKVWAGAAAVLLDREAAQRCAQRSLPRRGRVILVVQAEPGPADFQAAIAVGAQHVVTLPSQDGELMAELAEAAEVALKDGPRGAVVAVIAGRGGAGASVFATALAQTASEACEALLIDADPWSGGIDLLLGIEADSGLRWPDLMLQGGRLNYAALRDALPRQRGVSVLSGGRGGGDIDAAPLGAVIDAGSRGGATVVCDVPRRSTAAAETALESADLVIVVAPADVRSCAAAEGVARWVSSVNPNAGVVVRGPAPGGLRSCDVAEIVGLPLLAAMRPQARPRGDARARRSSTAAPSPARRRRSSGDGGFAAAPRGERGMSASLIERVRERLAAESGPLRPTSVAAAIRAESGGLLGDAEVLSGLRVLQTELTGAGILDPLLRADGTTDVLVTAPDAVWVDDGDGLRRTSIRFADDDAVRRLAQRLALSAGRRLDEAQPWVDGQLNGLGGGQFTVRLHAVLSPIAPGGTCLSLRVLRPATQDLAALMRTGTIEPARRGPSGRHHRRAPGLPGVRRHRRRQDDACWRQLWVRFPRMNASSVSRTPLNWNPHIPHLVKLVARCANVEGVGEVTVRDLVKQALRMRPDRIVVGEVRGAEVVDLLAALNTGHDGGAGTVHANSPAEVPARLEALAAVGGLDRGALHSQLAAAVQVLVHVSRDHVGRRRLSEIAVLDTGGDGRVRAVTAWRVGRGLGCGAERLRNLVRERRPA